MLVFEGSSFNTDISKQLILQPCQVSIDIFQSVHGIRQPCLGLYHAPIEHNAQRFDSLQWLFDSGVTCCKLHTFKVPKELWKSDESMSTMMLLDARLTSKLVLLTPLIYAYLAEGISLVTTALAVRIGKLLTGGDHWKQLLLVPKYKL